MSTLEKRLGRTLNAVHMEKVDKIPFSYSGPAYLAHAQGMKISEFVTDFDKATDAAVAFCKAHPGIDTLHTPIVTPYALATLWLSDVKVPGIDLPDDELWQMHEVQRMELEDYDKIIKMGYRAWQEEYMAKIGNPQIKMGPFLAHAGITAQRLAMEAGVMQVNGNTVGTPIEGICGARQLMNFFMDIMEEPELVKAALDEAMKVIYADFVGALEFIKPVGVWIGGWRAAPELMSHDTFMEFVWPYMKQLIDATLERNVLPILHFDSCWESELETINTLPPKSCLLMLDGTTDMRKARAVLDDRMALMGDVPSSMLAFASENQVYEYVTKLIDDVGPKTGLVVSSGCDCPLNAKTENVDAMIQATLDYVV